MSQQIVFGSFNPPSSAVFACEEEWPPHRRDYSVNELVTRATMLMHSGEQLADQSKPLLFEMVCGAVEGASNEPHKYRGELARLLPVLNETLGLHDLSQQLQRTLRAFINNAGGWSEVQGTLKDIERYRLSMEHVIATLHKDGTASSVVHLFNELEVELKTVRNAVAPSPHTTPVVGILTRMFSRQKGASPASRLQILSAKHSLEKREKWFAEFQKFVRILESLRASPDGSCELAVADALHFGRLCARIEDSGMNAPVFGFNESRWGNLWRQFQTACAPLLETLPRRLRQAPGRNGEGSPTTKATLHPRGDQSSVASMLETTGADSALTLYHNMFKHQLNSQAANEALTSLQSSFLWSRTTPQEKTELISHIVSWKKRQLELYGADRIDEAGYAELRQMATRMLQSDVARFASPRDQNDLRGFLSGNARSYLARQNAIQTLTIVYARSLMRTTIQRISERSAFETISEPTFDQDVTLNIEAIRGRLATLEAWYNDLYPGLEMRAKWRGAGILAISLSQNNEEDIFEGNDPRSNPVLWPTVKGSDDGVLQRTILALLFPGSHDHHNYPAFCRVEYGAQGSDQEEEDPTGARELSQDESDLVDQILNAQEASGSFLRSAHDSFVSTPSLRKDGFNLFRREDGALVAEGGSHTWILSRASAAHIDAFRDLRSGNILVHEDEWDRLELRVAELLAQRHAPFANHGEPTRIVAIHLNRLAGNDGAERRRIARMACAAAHLDFGVVVLPLGSDLFVDTFTYHYERLNPSTGAKPLVITSPDSTSWISTYGSIVHIVARSEIGSVGANGVILEDPILGEESGAAIYSPCLHHARGLKTKAP
jgi:hypothetical protein